MRKTVFAFTPTTGEYPPPFINISEQREDGNLVLTVRGDSIIVDGKPQQTITAMTLSFDTLMEMNDAVLDYFFGSPEDDA